MHCVFTTGYNRERAGQFVWVNPLLKDQMVLLKRKDGSKGPATMQEALGMKIGSQRGDFAVEVMEDLGVKDIDEALDDMTDADGNFIDPRATAGDVAAAAFRNGQDPTKDL